MKCMISVDGNSVVRVSDDKAAELFHEGFRYVSKSLWKEKVRDVGKSEEKTPKGNIKSNKMSKAQKRHSRKSS